MKKNVSLILLLIALTTGCKGLHTVAPAERYAKEHADKEYNFKNGWSSWSDMFDKNNKKPVKGPIKNNLKNQN